MLMSRDFRCGIDVALIKAFTHHRYPQLEFSQVKHGPENFAIVIDGFRDQAHMDEFTMLCEARTGIRV